MTTDTTTALRPVVLPAGEAGPEPEPSGTVMSLVEHLTELRNRIIKVVLAVSVGSVVGFVYNRQIRDLLLTPLPSHQLQVLYPGDAFSITIRIAIVTGVILAMPIIVYQAWAFIAPGLTEKERRLVRPWLPLSLLFFAFGVGLAWLVLPLAVRFLLSFTDDTLKANLAAGPYFSFVGTLFLGFGVVMQFPIVLYGLARVGIVSSARLRSWRRYVIVLIAIAGAALTPPDAFSDLAMTALLYGLYELTILAIARSGH